MRERTTPRRGAAAAAGVLAAALAASCVSSRIEGAAPLRVRNQHPAQLTAIHPDPRPPRPVPAGGAEVDLRVDWTSLWLRPGRGRDRIEMDGEIVRGEADLRVGLGSGVDLEVGIPVLHATGGFLDGFIEAWHDFFHLAQSGRDDFPRDRFRVGARRVRGDGSVAEAYRLEEDGVHLGDIPVFVSWFPVRSRRDGLTAGIRAGVELPAGDEGDGFGNGGLDASVGFLGGVDRRGYSLFAWGAHSWVHRPDAAREAGLGVPDLDSLGAGLEVGLLPRLSGLLQVEWERSLLRELDDDHADPDQALLWIGGRVRLPGAAGLEFAVGEDLISDVSPDVTFHLALSLAF